MKLKAKGKMQRADQISSTKKIKTPLSHTWEMSAQEALKVDYLTHSISF